MDSIIQKLFEEGDFELILQKIFLSLDGNSLQSCALVCKQWRFFILRLFQRKAMKTNLKQNWTKGVALSRKVHSDKSLTMKVDATSILVGLDDGSIELYNRFSSTTSKIQNKFKLVENTDIVRHVDLNPKYLVSASYEYISSIKLWCRKTGQLLDSFLTRESHTFGLCLVEDKIYYTGRSGKVCLLKIKNEKLVKEEFSIDNQTTIIDMSLDGDQLLTGGKDFTVKLWSIESQKLQKVFHGHENCINCVYIKGNYAISGSKDKTAKLWSVSNGTCLRTIYHSNEVRSVSFNSFVIFTAELCSDFFFSRHYNLVTII